MSGRGNQRGVSVWGILAVVAALLGAVGYNYNANQKAKREAAAAAAAADERNYSESLAKLTAATRKFDDAVNVARSAPRIAMAGPVAQLQAAMRDTEAISVHSCLADAQTSAVKRMKELTELFLVFMRSGSEATQKGHADAAEKYLWDFMAALKVCADSRLKR